MFDFDVKDTGRASDVVEGESGGQEGRAVWAVQGLGTADAGGVEVLEGAGRAGGLWRRRKRRARSGIMW